MGEYVNDNVAITTSFMCLEDGDAARDWMTRSGNGRQQSLVFKYLDTFPKPPVHPRVAARRSRTRRSSSWRSAPQKGTSIVGTPDECAEVLEKWDAIGVDQLIMGPSGSTYPYELVEETVELFGTKVIPRFDTDPEAPRRPLPPRGGRAPRRRLSDRGQLEATTAPGRGDRDGDGHGVDHVLHGFGRRAPARSPRSIRRFATLRSLRSGATTSSI